MFRTIRGLSGGLALWLLVSAAPRAGAEDVYFYRTVSELTVTEGRLPGERPAGRFTGHWRLRSAMHAYVAIEGEGEVYIDRPVNVRGGFVSVEYAEALTGTEVVAFRIPARREVTGKLYFPKDDSTGMDLVSFKAPPPQAQEDAKARFTLARRNHYMRLAQRSLPGAAWFRHQATEADSQNQAGRPAANALPGRGTTLEQTFNLFSGSQAIDENLQLDRPLPPQGAAVNPSPKTKAEPVKTDGLRGITVAEIDWAARLKGKTPALDPLANAIPGDQHALFLPGLKAAGAIMAEFRGDAFPVVGLVSPRSEDRGVQRRYEKQLGVSLADLGGFGGAGAIKSLAVTGSDPYLPSGTDLAVLIETGSPDELTAFLKSKLDAAQHAHTGAVDDGGELHGVGFSGARTPDRVLSAYVAAVDRVVVVTNSRAQLGRLIEAAHGKTPRLSEQPDYRFFRDRYTRGADDESALLVLTDATIRRWCGPRWRIGSSRRVRAGEALAEIQAENLPSLAAENRAKAATPKAPPGSIDLGAPHLDRSGVRSEVYGTLEFQTPIVELPLDEVGRDEADAYGRWRDGYQQNWRGVFDPIAARLSVRPRKLAADVTVMPLIAGSTYKPFLDLVGNARLEPDAGDRHPGSLVHAVMALDVQSKLFQQWSDSVASLTHVPQQVALGWLGTSAALYLDDDPFWAELAAAKDPQEFLSREYGRVPLGAHISVNNGARLALFLTGLRAFVEQSAPNVTRWENREHKGQRYVRVGEAEGARPDANGPKFALYYVSAPRSLTLSPNENVIKRAIERLDGKTEPAKGLSPWLGKSLAIGVSGRGFEALGNSGRTEYRDELQIRAWGNLPILNEWKRMFPDRDPVAFHEAVWGSTLVDPGGGRYVWNPRWATMESTVFGHPGEPKPGHETQNPLSRFGSAGLGVSFEDGGLRARTEVELTPRP